MKVVGPNWQEYKGYRRSTYTQLPDEMIHQHMAFLSLGELRVLLYVAVHTLGVRKKDYAGISLRQLSEGIRRRDGSIYSHGTGLSKRTLLLALASLEEKRLLIRERHQSTDHGHLPTSYCLNLDDDDLGEETAPRGLGEETAPRVGEETSPSPRGRNCTTQKRKNQETDRPDGLSDIPPSTPPPMGAAPTVLALLGVGEAGFAEGYAEFVEELNDACGRTGRARFQPRDPQGLAKYTTWRKLYDRTGGREGYSHEMLLAVARGAACDPNRQENPRFQNPVSVLRSGIIQQLYLWGSGQEAPPSAVNGHRNGRGPQSDRADRTEAIAMSAFERAAAIHARDAGGAR